MHKLAGGLCLMLVATISGGDESPLRPESSRLVPVEECRITLLDQVTLASDRAGIIKSLEFKEGQTVGVGSRIALIADEVARANLAVAEKKAKNDVEVKFAKVARDAAEKEFKMMETMAKESREDSADRLQAVAEAEVDKAKLARDKAVLSIDHAVHELELAKLNYEVTAAELKTYSVMSDFDGVVTRIFKKKGEAVRQGDPVAEIINTNRVRIEGRVRLSALPYATQGAKVLVKLSVDEIDLPDEDVEFEGRITFVDPVSDPVDLTTRIYAEVQNRDNILRPGLEAQMEIELDEQTAAKRARLLEQNKAPKNVSNRAAKP